MESLQIGVATHFRVIPLFSMRTVSLASLQSCCNIDTDFWCKWALKMDPFRLSLEKIKRDIEENVGIGAKSE